MMISKWDIAERALEEGWLLTRARVIGECFAILKNQEET